MGTLEKLVPNIYDLILANPPYYQDATINNQSKTIKIGNSEENAYTANGKNEYTALKPIHIKKYNDTISIPVKDNGEYDLEKQQELAQKIAYIKSIKDDICNKVKELLDVVIV